jgi:hypothetical protein
MDTKLLSLLFSFPKHFFQLATLLLFIGSTHSAYAMPEYVVRTNEALGIIKVNACFDKTFDGRLSTGRSKSHRYIESFRQGSDNIKTSSRYVYLQKKNQPTCVDYVVNLAKVEQDRQAWHIKDSWLVDNRTWLWRPTDQQGISLKFINDNTNTPAKVSAPWPKAANGNSYDAAKTPLGWSSKMAFGEFDYTDLDVNEQNLRVAILGVEDKAKMLELKQWIQHGAQAIASVSGSFPVNNAQILVLPLGKRSEPVPWAEVQRAGLPAVHLYIDQDRPIDEFYSDWTLTHELSHLLLPKISGSARWVYEGLASYYQNVLMARAQLQSPDKSWKKLRSGFAKGRKAAKSTSLVDSRRTKHVYWGGAALMYMADVELRLQQKGNSLDEVLVKLQNCCISGTKDWKADDFMQKLDELSQTTVFTELYKDEARQSQFPIDRNFEKVYNPIRNKELKGLLTPVDGLQSDY